MTRQKGRRTASAKARQTDVGVRKRTRTIHGISLDCVDGEVVLVAIPRLPLARNAVCEDLKPERKIGVRQRVALEAIFRFYVSLF